MSSRISSFQLGVDLDDDSSTDHAEVCRQNDTHPGINPGALGGVGESVFLSSRLDHFMRCGDKVFAGKHLIVDLWGARYLSDIGYIEQILREAADCAKATLLHVHLHHFTPNGGVSGVAMLAESHISIHSWPELGYAAFDIFMCGAADPDLAVEHLRKSFLPEQCNVRTLIRGEMVP